MKRRTTFVPALPEPGRRARHRPPGRALVVAVLALLLTSACGAGVTPIAPTVTLPPATPTQPLIMTQPTARPTASAPPAAPTSAATATEASGATTPTGPAGATFQNPVLAHDFADPDVLQVGNVFYAFATNAGGLNVESASSRDLVNWQLGSDAMPALATWVAFSNAKVWAPEAFQLADGSFALYYTGHDQTSNRQCVGVALATKPQGLYRDKSDRPLVCQADQGGDIDPSPFLDNGKLYLYWKNDGNCCAQPTHLYVQELSPDGKQLVGGQPVSLTENTEVWEGNVVEAPRMLKHDNAYYLFFSANGFGSDKYSVGYATCQSATGPCTQAPENPILHSKMDAPPLVVGPGGETFAQVGNQTWILYHAWDVVNGTRGNTRSMWMDRLDWKGGKPVVEGPTTGPQPVP